jgi:3-carboxy-cis,cis-muconate cycloisomerase
LPSEGLFGPLLSTPALLEAVGDEAWVAAMLAFEGALARAEASLGLVPADAAEEISRVCAAGGIDPAAVGRGVAEAANPAIPLLREITARLPQDAAAHLHRGATSQDVVDTAAMLVSRDALGLVIGDLDAAVAAAAGLARAHRGTVMAGRTLLQQAVPITFGLKAAGWLVGLADARDGLLAVRADLAVQLGGAAGTLAPLGAGGAAVVGALATELGLAEPVLPWHSARGRVARLGATLAIATGSAAKVALDVALLMQTEVAEAGEPAAPGRGGSSAMPQKRNPVLAVEINAAARRSSALAGVLLGALAAEHERAAGGWQAEWETLRDLLLLAGGAAARIRETLAGLEVHPGRMRANLDAGGGVLLAERVSARLAGALGRTQAHERVAAAVRAATTGDGIAGGGFAGALAADPVVAAALEPGELTGLLDPAGYLGCTDAFIDRALERA